MVPGNYNLILKKELKTKAAAFGFKIIPKLLKRGYKIEKIYVASDTRPETKKELEHLKHKEEKIDFVLLDISKEDLKDICKKQFNVSVVSILNEKFKPVEIEKPIKKEKKIKKEKPVKIEEKKEKEGKEEKKSKENKAKEKKEKKSKK